MVLVEFAMLARLSPAMTVRLETISQLVPIASVLVEVTLTSPVAVEDEEDVDVDLDLGSLVLVLVLEELDDGVGSAAALSPSAEEEDEVFSAAAAALGALDLGEVAELVDSDVVFGDFVLVLVLKVEDGSDIAELEVDSSAAAAFGAFVLVVEEETEPDVASGTAAALGPLDLVEVIDTEVGSAAAFGCLVVEVEIVASSVLVLEALLFVVVDTEDKDEDEISEVLAVRHSVA